MLKLQKHERAAAGVAEAIFDQAQLEHRRERGKKHLCIVVTYQDSERKLPIAGSPRGDETSLVNMTRQQATKMVRELGIDPTGEPLKKAS